MQDVIFFVGVLMGSAFGVLICALAVTGKDLR